jgi:SAM-dependent methyltransferase
MSTPGDHWQQVYGSKAEAQTSWFRPHLEESLRLIDALRLPPEAPVVDVGAGRSTLVDDLLARGFIDVSALDISADALAQSRARLGNAARKVRWLEGDVLEAHLPPARFDLWHDRAVFHFLTEAAERDRYLAQCARSLRMGGFALVATFAADGPDTCSGLPVCRYDAAALAAEFGPRFETLAHSREQHRTPFDTTQSFTYLLLRRIDPEANTTP